MAKLGGVVSAGLVAVLALIAALYKTEVTPRVEDGLVELGKTEVLLIARCAGVFNFMSDLSNYPQWFPGVSNMTELMPGPMEAGKRFHEVITYPVIGNVERLVYVTDYSPPHKMTFIYSDWTMLSITVTATQTTHERCLVAYSIGTKRTSYLFQLIPGLPFKMVYSLRGRHAMFAIRSMFNNGGNGGGGGLGRMVLPDIPM